MMEDPTVHQPFGGQCFDGLEVAKAIAVRTYVEPSDVSAIN